MRKYNLPSSSPLFQSMTTAEILLERYEDLHAERSDLEQKRKTSKLEDWERDRLTLVQSILEGEDVSFGDPLIEKWEREIAEGKIPDLDEEG